MPTLQDARVRSSAKKTTAKRHASNRAPRPNAHDSSTSLHDLIVQLVQRMERALAPAFGDAASVGFGQQVDHDFCKTFPSVNVTYTLPANTVLSEPQLKACRKAAAVFHEPQFDVLRSVFVLNEQFM
jgi:hypothetical protein